MVGTDFLISTIVTWEKPVKSKIIGFSKTARWNSLKINGRSQFLIYFHFKNFKIGSENLRIFSIFWCPQLKEYRKVTIQLDFHRNASSFLKLFINNQQLRIYVLNSFDIVYSQVQSQWVLLKFDYWKAAVISSRLLYYWRKRLWTNWFLFL